MSAGNINTVVEINNATYNVNAEIPKDNDSPYTFEIANDAGDNRLIGLAVQTHTADTPTDVYLSVSPPKSVLPEMIKSLSVEFTAGEYTSTDNPIVTAENQKQGKVRGNKGNRGNKPNDANPGDANPGDANPGSGT
jgi:hypothetical protein